MTDVSRQGVCVCGHDKDMHFAKGCLYNGPRHRCKRTYADEKPITQSGEPE